MPGELVGWLSVKAYSPLLSELPLQLIERLYMAGATATLKLPPVPVVADAVVDEVLSDTVIPTSA